MATVRPALRTDAGTVAAKVESSAAVDVAAPAPLDPASPTNRVPAAMSVPPVIANL